jgi:O-antigen ligase
MTGLFIAIHELFALRTKRSLFYSTIIAVLLISIFATFSRTTWIATLFGILVLISLRKRGLSLKKLVLLCVVALSILFMNDFIIHMMEINIIRLSPQQSDSRTWIWLPYFKIALENPFGQGIGSIETIRYFVTHTYSLTSTARPHNLFLSIWVEAGIQTLIPFVALIIVAIRYGWSVRSFVDPISGKNYGNVTVVILLSLSIGVFGLGGMIQLVMLAIAMNIVVWLLVKEGKLVNRDEHMEPGSAGQSARNTTYRFTW